MSRKYIVYGLNPCFSGTYSRRGTNSHLAFDNICLNPCFSGTYSRSGYILEGWQASYVLILVLVEHTLGADLGKTRRNRDRVLILVLVEHTLGDRYPAIYVNMVPS